MNKPITWCGPTIDCNHCQLHRCKLAQPLATKLAIQLARDRIETKRSIAERKEGTSTEKAYALTMLELLFPSINLYAGEKALLRVVGKNAV